MEDKKFYGVGIGFGIVAFVLATFEPVIGFFVGILSLWINMKKRNQYRVKIGVVLSVVGMLFDILFIASIIWMGLQNQNASTDYWLFQLLFGNR